MFNVIKVPRDVTCYRGHVQNLECADAKTPNCVVQTLTYLRITRELGKNTDAWVPCHNPPPPPIDPNANKV